MANDGSAIQTTTSAYNAGTTIPIIAAAGTATVTPAKLPYASADFEGLTGNSLSINGRVVGVGVRIRYIGPELARSGQIIAFRSPDNGNMLGRTFAEARSLETSKTFSNKRQWVYAMYRPTRPEEYTYSPNGCTASDGANYKWSLGFCVTGTTNTSGSPGPAPFEGEVIQFIEYTGNINNVTRTHVDLKAMSHIRNSLPEKSVTENIAQHAYGVASKVVHSIKEAAPEIGAGALAAHLLSGTAEVDEGATAALAAVPKQGFMGELLEAGAEVVPYVEEGLTGLASLAAIF
jgi:hypothetical protein